MLRDGGLDAEVRTDADWAHSCLSLAPLRFHQLNLFLVLVPFAPRRTTAQRQTRKPENPKPNRSHSPDARGVNISLSSAPFSRPASGFDVEPRACRPSPGAWSLEPDGDQVLVHSFFLQNGAPWFPRSPSGTMAAWERRKDEKDERFDHRSASTT